MTSLPRVVSRRWLAACRATSRPLSSTARFDLSSEDFASPSHPGYAQKADPVTGLGGWWQHRRDLAVPGSGPLDDRGVDWTTAVAEHLTRPPPNPLGRPLRILVLFGSLRQASYSAQLAREFARLLEVLGCDVRIFNPHGLPLRDPALEDDVKVQELRALSAWSDGHVWCSPEMHGAPTSVFKNQIDWLPLSQGSVRPTQGRTCLVAQVCGGSQSFNTVVALRTLARWMRMPCCTNQSSVPKAWQEFGEGGRMRDSPFRDRVVDVAEEFAKFTLLCAPQADSLTDRYSERKERVAEGRLLTQAEKEARVRK